MKVHKRAKFVVGFLMQFHRRKNYEVKIAQRIQLNYIERRRACSSSRGNQRKLIFSVEVKELLTVARATIA